MKIDPFTIIYVLFAFNLICTIVNLLFIEHLMNRISKLEEDVTAGDQYPIKTLIAESQELQARLIAQEEERMAGNDKC